MRAVKVNKDEKGVKVTFTDEKYERQKQRQAKLATLTEKRAKGRLTLEDLDAKLDIVLEMLEELVRRRQLTHHA